MDEKDIRKKYFLKISVFIFSIFIIAAYLMYSYWFLVNEQNTMMTFSINLLTTAIGLFLTLILLVYLIDKRNDEIKNVIDKREEEMMKRDEEITKTAKNAIMAELRRELGLIYIDISNFVKGSTTVIASAIDTPKEELEKREKEIFYATLEKLAKSDKLEINDVYKEYLSKGMSGEIFVHRKNELNDFETKYIKFLHPDIISGLITIQKELGRIDTNINIKVKQNDMLEKVESGEYKDLFIPWFKTDEEFFIHLSESFRKIIKEIYDIHQKHDIDIYLY